MRERAGRTIAALVAVVLPALAAAQQPPPPTESVKGKVLEVAATTIRIQSGRRAPETFLLAPDVRDAARRIRKGSEIVASVRHAPEGPRIMSRIISVTEPVPTGTTRDDRPGDPTAPRRGTVLLTVDRECELTIDLDRRMKLPKGGTTLELAPGEHLLEAVAADGARWRKAVKVGTEQTVVEIVLGAPATPPAEWDAAAAQVWLALQEVGVAGRRVAWVLSRTNFGFQDPGLAAAMQRAHGRLRREAERLAALTGEEWRREAQVELARAAGAADRYVDLLTQAVTRAQQDGTVLGEAATLRAKALAEEPAMAVAPKAAASLRAAADFARALPADRRAAAGLPPDAQDFALGAEYDDGEPPVLGIVSPDGLADGLGLEPGDRVLSVDGQAPRGGWHLKQLLRAAAGRKAAIEVERRGKRSTLRATVPSSLPR